MAHLNPDTLSPTLTAWHARGAALEVPGTASTRIWRDGEGPAVVCLHGVPASAFLYRKLLPELARRGLEGVAFDFPGLGFADRPVDFDYSWTGLADWMQTALDAAHIDAFHLVVHDIGGPIGFDFIRKHPQRILSLTVLNTLVYVARFTKPLVMRPFEMPVLGAVWVRMMDSPAIAPFFRWQGALSGPGYSELRAYGELLRLGDRGRAFLDIMRSFETTEAFEARILPPLRDRTFPAQVIWGRYDTALPMRTRGADLKRALRLQSDVHAVAGKHFLQEDAYEDIAERIERLVQTGKDL